MSTPAHLTAVSSEESGGQVTPTANQPHSHAVVEWFCSDRGFGHLRTAADDLVFVSQRDIQRDGFRALDDGQHVTFVLGSDAHGPVARHVAPVADAASGAIAS